MSRVWITTAAWLVTAASAVTTIACQSAAPAQNTLDVYSTNLTVPNPPFGLVYAGYNVAFAAIAGGYVGVLNTSTFTPTLIREIKIPGPFYESSYVVGGLAITHDKQTVYVSIGSGAVAIDVEKAVAGEAGSIAGYLNGTDGTGAIETALSPDDNYAFVSQEYGSTLVRGAVEVFKVQRADNGSVSSTYIGYTPLGGAVVGTALSSDGCKLYATSELATLSSTYGTLSVLDVATLKTNPPNALLTSVEAGCNPVRVAVSPNGKHVWVTARESNMLLAFDAAKLESNSSDALLASVQVGTSPVGLIFVNHGRHIITADSNRFSNPNTTTGLTVVDVEAALKGKQGFPRIPTGLFPREFAVSPDGKTLLISEFGSKAIQVVNVSQLAYD